jgi:hypothetical protein
MTTSDYQMHHNLIHELVMQLEELEKDNLQLSKELALEKTENAKLQVLATFTDYKQPDMFRMPNDPSELRRIDWQQHHQMYKRKTDTRPPKYH